MISLNEHFDRIQEILSSAMCFVKATILNACRKRGNDSFARRNKSSREKSFAAVITVNRRRKFKSNNVMFL